MAHRSINVAQDFVYAGRDGYVPHLERLLRAHARGEEVLHAAVIVVEGHHAVASVGERPGGVQDSLQYGVELQALVDAKAGLAQPGQTLPQRLILSLQPVGLVHGWVASLSVWGTDLRVRRI